jgi:hypothetical protein
MWRLSCFGKQALLADRLATDPIAYVYPLLAGTEVSILELKLLIVLVLGDGRNL